ncbi:hypothetical protein D3C80_1250620 [compost metagenome]
MLYGTGKGFGRFQDLRLRQVIGGLYIFGLRFQVISRSSSTQVYNTGIFLLLLLKLLYLFGHFTGTADQQASSQRVQCTAVPYLGMSRSSKLADGVKRGPAISLIDKDNRTCLDLFFCKVLIHAAKVMD